jgi:hypothetical protein
MWFGFEGINDVDFWHEPEPDRDRPMEIGTVRHREFTRADTDGKTVVIATRNDWLNRGGAMVCQDERILQFGATHGARWIDFQIQLSNVNEGLRIGDSKEGLLALRVAASMAVDAGLGGRIMNSRGQSNADAWGQPAEWVDYHGPIDGTKVGIAILSHPRSFTPVPRWHVRPYGLLAVNPFGVAPFTGQSVPRPHVARKPNEPIFLHYRVVLHVGDEKQAELADHFRHWATPP